MRVVVRDAERPLVQVRLADDRGAGPTEARHDERVFAWHAVGEELRAGGRAHTGGVEQVLDRDGHPRERSALLTVGLAACECARRTPRIIRGDGDERVDFRVAFGDARYRG